MNTIRHQVALAVLWAGSLAAQADPYAAWTQRAPVHVPGPGLVRVELPPEVLDASGSKGGAVPLNDLRLAGRSGVETPFRIEWPRVVPGRSREAEDFRASLEGNTTVVEFGVPAGAVVREVRLETGNRNFIKAATVAGTLDGTEWRMISDRELLFRQGGAERLGVPLGPAAWRKLRITLDDGRSGPVGFTGATLLTREEDEAPVTTRDVRILSREDAKGETRLELDLGARNQSVAALRIIASDPLFQREVKLDVPREDGSRRTISAARSLYRIALDDRKSEDVDFPLNQIVPERFVVLRILNGDNPPLQIERIEGLFHQVALVFHAEAAGTWQLMVGNANATTPRYDVAALLGDSRHREVTPGSIGALEANPTFNKEATLPETGEGGALLDVAAWAYRRTVDFSEPGVIRVELDAVALAHAAPEQRDVRVVQEGRQLPYLIQRGLPQQEVKVGFREEPDAKRPSLSRWSAELPFGGYPVVELIATTRTALFERQLLAWEEAHDAYGNRFRRTLGQAPWRRTASDADATLRMKLSAHPTGEVIHLETDNGDNAPMQLESVRLAYRPVAVVFQTTSTSPVEIAYGNPRAYAPRYDIQLIRAQFERAGQTNATLGPEARGEGYRAADPGGAGTGSPWLWGALALVVGGLLWVVARLLPAETQAK